MTSFKAVELIFEQSLNISGKPSNPWLGYGYGEGWTNPTRTRTPGQPAALTHGFLKPVTIPKTNLQVSPKFSCRDWKYIKD